MLFSNERGYGLPDDRDREIARLQQEVKDLKARLNELSWQTNPDRSGGAYTPEETNPNRGWLGGY
jgi:hypothetical protein